MSVRKNEAPPNLERIESLIRTIADFPSPGILFRDLTPVLADPAGFEAVLSAFEKICAADRPEAIVAIEARGFLFGAPLAARLRVPLIPVRKAGKLPFQVRKVSYALEYGTAELEMHTDALAHGTRALVVDDVLATGGTAVAAAELVRSLGGTVSAFAFVVELPGLGGAARLREAGESGLVHSLVQY